MRKQRRFEFGDPPKVRGKANADWARAANPLVIGKRFGRLIVLKELPYKKGEKRSVLLECDCGKRLEKPVYLLGRKNGGVANSCGCLKVETTRARSWQGCGQVPRAILYRMEQSAKEKGLECNVTVQYLDALLTKQENRCAISGVPIVLVSSVQKRERRQINTASVDRSDSSRGYVFGNVQWVHKDVNIMKNTMSMDDFLIKCYAIVETNRARIAELDHRSAASGTVDWQYLGRNSGRKRTK